jgi:hypothetical protein
VEHFLNGPGCHSATSERPIKISDRDSDLPDSFSQQYKLISKVMHEYSMWHKAGQRHASVIAGGEVVSCDGTDQVTLQMISDDIPRLGSTVTSIPGKR